MSETAASATLSKDGCEARQRRLVDGMRQLDLDGALLTDPRHVHYFTGFWHSGRPLFRSALFLTADGRTRLFLPFESETDPVAEQVQTFESNHLGTLVEDQEVVLGADLRELTRSIDRLGCDQQTLSSLAVEGAPGTKCTIVPIGDLLRELRRKKDVDEVELLRAAIRGCDAAYDTARRVLVPGLTEVELYAQMRAAAIVAVGEPLTEFGNDFQCGNLGSLPRPRAVEAGDTAILDVSVVLRGYSSDLCRTFVISAPPTNEQKDAHERVVAALEFVEENVRPGVSCKELHEEVFSRLDGYRGWKFPHHLGHGIGLSAHEAPRLNPRWNDTFREGDVFTAEPGLYGTELRAGIRVEHDYLVTESGVERLSDYSTDLFTTG